jgi:serine/threonine-protein kinase
VAQRFGMEIRDAEHLLRIERMMPIHDIRPAEARLRARMEEIRREMERFGSVAKGPGLYAIGRGHLALRDYEKARETLESAWEAGFQAPEVAYAIGIATLKLHEKRWEALVLERAGPEAYTTLEQDYLVPALPWMERAKGASVDHPAYGAALVAFAQKRYDDADAEYAKALEQAPWLYEAWLGRALVRFKGKGTLAAQEQSQAGLDHLYQAAEEQLKKALLLAPSDHELHYYQTNIEVGRWGARSARGSRDPAPLRRAVACLDVALVVRPDSVDLALLSSHLTLQFAFHQLGSGGDPGELLRNRIRAVEPILGAPAQVIILPRADTLGQMYFLTSVLAEADWRYGRDPRPSLAEAARFRKQWNVPDIHRIWSFHTELAAATDYDMDVDAIPGQAERDISLQGGHEEWKAFHHAVWGSFLLEQARWEQRKGRKAEGTLSRAIRDLERSCEINPYMVYAFYDLPRAYALRARIEMARGQDASRSVRESLAAARKGLSLNANNAEVRIAEADARRTEGLWRASRNEDPSTSIEACRRAIRAGLAVNPQDFRLFLELARAELDAARWVRKVESDPAPFLEASSRAARRGLAIKGDSRELKEVLAECGRPRHP